MIPLNLSKSIVLLLGVLSMMLTHSCGAPSTDALPPGPAVETLQDLVDGSELIVVAQVSEVKPGRTVETQEEELQFNDVILEVEQMLKGEANDSVTVEQLDAEGKPVSAEVGDPYDEGQRYVLFLQPGEGDRQVTLPQGRFLLEGGEVKPTQPGDVAQEVEGMKEAQFIQQIQELST
jgi:hypothetical protein